MAVGAATVIAGAYGTLTINSDGSYSYVADQAAAQGLGVGEAVDDVFTYEVSDGNGGTDTATLTVTVTGANDAPVITSSASFSVDENTTAVGTVAATDADTNDTVSYSISGGADGALFTIDGATGELSFIASPDFDAPGDAGADNVYEVEVTASDGNGGTSVQTISVTVGDVNEAPTDITLSNASVEENSTNGTVVGTLGAADPDAGESFTYTLLDNAGGRFAIVGNELRVADGGLLDFETATSHQVTVEVEDSAGNTRQETFTVSVTDVNEAPVATDDAVAAVEDGGSVPGDVLNNDTDPEGDTLAVTSIAASRGPVAVSAGAATVIAGAYGTLTIDADGSYSYVADQAATQGLGVGEAVDDVFTYVISDGNGGTDTATLTVTVTGANDAPVITSSASFSIDENTTAVGTVAATDADTNDTVGYSISGGADGVLFAIDGATGELSFIASPDFDAPGDAGGDNVYEVEVTASDGNGGTSVQTISVTVGDVNEAPTDITLSNASVAENSGNGTVVGTLGAADPDAGESFTYTLLDNAGGRFAIVGNELRVADGGLLDFETATSHQVTVEVEDSAGNTWQETFTLSVTDVNETPTDITLSNASVAENSANGTVVGTLGAADPDAGESFTYTLLDNAGGRFAIVGNELRVADGGLLDFEANASHQVTVEVEDSAGNTRQETFTVSVSDVNEAPTDITLSNASVAENSADDTVVGTLGATDQDAGESFTYTLLDNAGGRFAIFGNELRVADGGLLDFETNASHQVTVEVEDSAGNTRQETFTVQVTNANEATVAVDDTNSASEDGPAIAANVLDNDSDADGDTLSVSTVSAGGAPVAVGAATVIAGAYGTLTINSDGSYSYVADQAAAQGLGVGEAVDDVFTYEVSDGNGGTDTATLTVTVTGANDAPVITSSASFSVDENTTAVGTVAATDADTNDTVSYSISGGADGALFTIDGATGELSFIASPDFDAPGDAGADNVYEVEVTASDGNGGTSVQTISVTVGDVNEAPTDITLSNASVEENSTNGTVVGTLGAADPDAGESFTYTLLDNAGGRFAIVGNELRVADGGLLDFETATSHQVTVEVEDSAG
ncbi:cadherin domain-containing protein, partial [Stappia sp. F7233]